ncbi:MAG: site-specific integrase [Actinomycetota bacterium]|nr:site-specific integrase [Actinomycetota bacterium]
MQSQRNDPFKRYKTRHPGVTYRTRADGSRTYAVHVERRWVAVEGGEAEAVALQAELRGKKSRGEIVRPSSVKFGAFSEEWIESKRRLRPWTRKQYEGVLAKYLVPRFGNRKLASITTSDVAGLVRDLETHGLSRNYIDNILKPLAGTFKLAIRRGLVGVNPVLLLTEEERPERKQRDAHEWTTEEIDTFLGAAQRRAAGQASRFDYYPLLLTAVRTGLRLGELLGLRWGDVELGEHPAIHVRQQWTRTREFAEPKTAKALRRVPLGPSMVTFLREHRRAAFEKGRASGESLVFASLEGTPLTHRNVQRRGFEKARDLAGLSEHLTFHSLRHAFASVMIERGVSEFVLADLMGHTDPATTRRVYVHLFNRQRSDTQVREAMESAMALEGGAQ